MSSGARSSDRTGGDAGLLGGERRRLGLEVGLVEAAVNRKGPTVDAADATLTRQLVEVAADGCLGHAQRGAQLLQADGVAGVDDLGETFATGDREVDDLGLRAACVQHLAHLRRR